MDKTCRITFYELNSMVMANKGKCKIVNRRFGPMKPIVHVEILGNTIIIR